MKTHETKKKMNFSIWNGVTCWLVESEERFRAWIVHIS